ncbi:MAG: AI-2E family transporter [Atopobiaceae bacterium]|nr:AI-2E family transporter [Atopobiaceae bacterium]
MARFTDKIDKGFVRIAMYVVATVALSYGACMALSYSGGFFTKLWSLVTAVLLPMIYGGLLSYLLQPVVRKICGWVERTPLGGDGTSRAWNISVALAVALVFIVIALILTALLFMVTKSLSGVNMDSLKALFEDAQGNVNEFMGVIQEAASSLGLSTEWIKNIATGAVSSVKDFFTTALFAVIFGVYFLLDGKSVTAYGQRLVHALVGDSLNAQAEQVFSDADRVFSGYIRGQFVDAALVGTLGAVLFSLLGIPYGGVVGMLMGIGNLIPYVGTPTGIVSVILVCLAQGDWQRMIAGLVAIGVIGFVDGNIINPRLLSESVDVHPLLVVAALIAGGAIGGIAGMLVAVPAAAFLKVQLDRWMESREVEEGPASEGEDVRLD